MKSDTKRMRLPAVLFRNFLMASALLAVRSPAQAPGLEIKIRLTAPLNTKLSRPGDLVIGKVLDPAEYAGGYLEGEVREVHPGTASRRSATIDFQFHTLHVPATAPGTEGKQTRVSVGVVHLANSRRQADTDEDGAAIEQGTATSGGGLGLSRLTSGVISRVSRGGDKQSGEKQSGEKQAVAPPKAITRLSAKALSLSLAAGSELAVQVLPPVVSKSKAK